MKKFFLFAATAALTFGAYAQVKTFSPVREFNTEATAPRGMKINKNIVLGNNHSKLQAPARVSDFDLSIIDEQPEGTVQVYARNGGAISVSMFGAIITTQNGKLCEVTTAPDGKTVYIKDPISTVVEYTWVKGTIEDGKIHVALPQTIYYDYEKGYGLAITWSNSVYDAASDKLQVVPDLSVKEATYTINEDGSIVLDGAEEASYGIGTSLLTTIWTDDESWAGYSDWATELTPFNEVVNTIPEGVVLEDYVLSSTEIAKKIQVGFADGKVYIDGVAQAPVVGTIEGDKATFESNQYVGMQSGYASYFVGATTEELYDSYYEEYYNDFVGQSALVLNYDAATKKMTPTADNQAFVINAGKSEDDGYIDSFDAYSNPTFFPFTEVEGTPETPLFNNAMDYTASYGQWYLDFNVPNTTVDGDFIDPAKLEWCLMTDGEIYTFSADDGYYLSEDLDWLPYGFRDEKDGYDIGAQGSLHFVYLYSGLFSEVSVQSRATYGENVYYSKICTLDLETLEYRVEDDNPTGIQTIETAKSTKNLFDLQGRRVNAAKGLVINNGKVTFVK